MGKRCVSPARRNRQTSTTPLLSQTRAGREGGIPPDERSFYLEIHRALSLLILPLRGIFLSILSMPGLRKLTQKSRLLAQRMVRMEEPLPIETREEGVGASPLGSRPSKMVPVPFYCPSNTRRRLLSVCPVFARPEIQLAMSVRRCPLASCSALALALAPERPCR